MTNLLWILTLGAFAVIGIIFLYDIELKMRRKFHASNFQDPALHTLNFYTNGGVHKEPKREIAFRYYMPSASLMCSADIRLNNMGCFSSFDYACERSPNERRILVLGGEQTASSVVDRSWPDFLQEELQRRDPAPHWKVFNLGWPDAGPEHYLDYWNREGKDFNADLVIINFPETDFFRTRSGTPLTYKGKELDSINITYSLGSTEDDKTWTPIRCVKGSKPTSLRDPNAVPSKPYGMFSTRMFMSDPQRVARLQKIMADDMIVGDLPPFGYFLFQHLTGKRKKFPRVAERRNFDQIAGASFDQAWQVSFGVKSFRALMEAIPNLLFLHNFNYWEYRQKTDFAISRKIMEADPRIRLIDMREYMPDDLSEEELKSWYLFPLMVEKWSGQGHQAYAKMVADVILERVDLAASQALKNGIPALSS